MSIQERGWPRLRVHVLLAALAGVVAAISQEAAERLLNIWL
jgi:hypothetical protein